MAVSLMVAGTAVRLIFDAERDRGPASALLLGVRDLLSEPAPLPGARPAPGDALVTDQPTGGLITRENARPGQPVRLDLVGEQADDVDSPPPAQPIRPVPAAPTEVAGLVTLNGTPREGVPIDVIRSGRTVAHVETGPDGIFRAEVSREPILADAEFSLLIPASALAEQPNWIPFLSPSSIPWVLATAFAWIWVGLAVVVFRAGLRSIPAGLLRTVRAYGASRARQLAYVVLPALLPATAVVLLAVLVATTRVFDLIVVAAPGPTQAGVDVVGIHWWRFKDGLGEGGAAALAVLLFLLLAAAALVTVWGLSRDWPTASPARPDPGPRPATRRAAVVVSLVATVAWVMPFAVLLLTSLRSPRDAAVSGWWAAGRDGWGLESYRQAFASGELAGAVLGTASRATLATVLTVLFAVPAAYALARGDLPRRAVRWAVVGTVVLAVAPAQAVVDPLNKGFEALRLAGTPIALTLVYVALGLPFAVLLLRAAFAAVPERVVRHARLGDTRPGDAFLTVLARCWPTVLAAAVLEFVLVWNDLVVGLWLGGSENQMITLVLFRQVREFTTSSGVLAASAVISMGVPVILVLCLGTWLVRGLTAGVAR
jgi:alpha-glucoside transport system permease protein